MTVRKLFCALLCALSAPALLPAQVLPSLPLTWRWTSDHEVALSLDGTFAHEDDRLVDARTGKVTPLAPGMVAASAAADGSAFPADMVNATWSPDSAHVAFTKGNDLWVKDMQSGETRRLTHDGSDTILNGYASWVYYEEIFGRPSRYRAFWWSPDSRKVAFYRFDNADVPVFPIYSPYAEDYDRSWLGVYSSQAAGAAVPLDGVSPTGGSVRMTRYPKCGDPNPKVRIGIADLDRGGEVVWADFNEEEDQYFGTPFWGADSRRFFVQREPRTQNTLDLYAVSPEDGSKQCIYHETYPTWLDWIDGMLFGRDGLYMVRSFETGWQQIYYLSYDGTVCKRLTDGQNWRVRLLTVKEGKKTASYDGTASEVVFTAERDSRIRSCLYMARKGAVKVLSDPDCMVAMVSVSPGKDYAVGMESSLSTPYRFRLFDFAKPSRSRLLADSADPDDPSLGMFPAPRVETIRTDDGLELPAIVLLPKDFDPSRKYPVHMDIYGGPDTPMVYDRWIRPGYEEFSMNGIIEVIADCRAAGHNGRAGLDAIYGRLGEKEVQDFVAWAEHFKSLPYVDGEKIGVEGFSFGGTMTALLVLEHSDAFHYGIAGGGVYDWALYDTHYTERFMDTPQNNPEGYAATRVTAHVAAYPVTYDADPKEVAPVMLKLTHGTGDDNVHYQNTLLLVNELVRAGKKFELMVYPDGLHGYRGYQAGHFDAANMDFWLKYLKR